jgi:hypothetical protein
MAVLLAICRHAELGFPVSLHDSFYQHPEDPEQAQSADSTYCIPQRQISAADMTRCVEGGYPRHSVSARGELRFGDSPSQTLPRPWVSQYRVPPLADIAA